MLHAFGRTESRIMNTSFIKDASYYNNEYECVQAACLRMRVWARECVCVRVRARTQICMHACASMLVSPCSMCMRLQPGRGVHPSPFLVSSFNSP